MKIPLIDFYDLAGICTPVLLTILAIGVLLLDLVLERDKVNYIGGFTLFGLFVVLACQLVLHIGKASWEQEVGPAFGGIYFFDLFSIYFNYLFLVSAILTVAMGFSYMKNKSYHRGEYYILLLIATIGMCLLAGARDLIVAFGGLEVMTIPIYALCAIDRTNLKSNEAGLKYLLMGAFASGILLYGMALLYGSAGATDFVNLSHKLAKLKGSTDLQFFFMLVGLGFVIVGFGFKIAAVPFHMWAPDVYEGAPTPITAYMASGVKSAGFAILIRMFLTALNGEWVQSYPIFWALSALTMTVGNLCALLQRNIKRMLAYSSIAHAGYLLVGITALVASDNMSEAWFCSYAMIYYLIVYLFMNIGAFAVVVALSSEKRGGEYLEDYAGLGLSRPFLAAAMAVFMFSLAGIPPLGGFLAKFYVFQAGVQARLYYLVVIAVLNSVVSAFYYLRVVYIMYMQFERERMEPTGLEEEMFINAVLIITVVMIFILGLFPAKFLEIISSVFYKFV